METLKPRRQVPRKAKKKPIKITYISNPMRVRANDESEFRSLVQELTGKNSTVGYYAEEEEEAVDRGESTVNDTPAESPVIGRCEDGQVISSGILSNLDFMEASLWVSELYGFQSPYFVG